MLAIVLFAGALLYNRNADATGQFSNRGRKIHMFVFHDKAKNTAAHAAPEAVKSLSLRTNMKRRRLFLMKWAKGFEVRPGAFQWKIGPDDFDNVICGRYLLDCFRRDHRFDFSLVWGLKRCQI